MIISLRGTNGSGKSTIARNILNKYSTVRTLMLPDRKKPAGYICERGLSRLFIPGHYEIANGGIDTLDLDQAYKLILSMHEFGCDVLYEGQNMGDSARRVLEMHQAKIDIRVIFIDYPRDKCIDAVRDRGHTIKKETIINIYNKCLKQQAQLENIGIHCVKRKRAEAQKLIQKWLGLK
jgi:tRNA uridine 5-carbamoylmethylation protein Kti12